MYIYIYIYQGKSLSLNSINYSKYYTINHMLLQKFKLSSLIIVTGFTGA